MLHWFAGQKSHESNGDDPDTTGYVEPPETPAPVFAVRAFKHAIFGTPATEKPKAPRRHSSTEDGRSGAPSRPRMMRPKSTNDAAALARLDDAAVASEPLPSPTKGILMTPGTAGGKRKTVTFPDHVMHTEEKRPTKTGLPEDCPGKFPSPWTKSSGDVEHVEDSTHRPGGRSKLTEALEQARDESTKRKVRLGRPEKSQDDLTADLAEPVSDSGSYWKREYDIYREKTTAEVRKLVAKQKLAKNYARDKDDQCMELSDELRQEKKKADNLQRRTEELEARLKQYQGLLKQSRAAEESAKDELERLKRGFGTTGYRKPVATTTSLALSGQTDPESKPCQSSDTATASMRTATTDTAEAPPASREQQPEQGKVRRRPRETQSKAHDDLWAPSSTLEPPPPDPPRPSSSSSRGSRAVTSGTGATPLQLLSVNSGPKQEQALSLATSMGLQQPPPSPTRPKRQDSPLQPAESSAPTPAPALAAAHEDLSIAISSTSSPFDPDATLNKPPPFPPSSPTAERSARKALRRSAVDTKENISPVHHRPKSSHGVEKPSVAWSAMNAPAAAAPAAPAAAAAADKRQRALERAREKLASRGRMVS